jgi:Ca-activated chloride channel family protein
MNDHTLLPDDPRLTAYALGELDAPDRAAVEAALRDDPVARAAVAEIRALGAHLEGALAREASTDTTAASPAAAVKVPEPSAARAAIIPGLDLSKLDGGSLHRVNGRSSPLAKVVSFPQFYYVAAGLAAACFALMVALRTPKPSTGPQVAYKTIDLASLPTAARVEPSEAAAAETTPAAGAAAPATVVVNLAPADAAVTAAAPAAPQLLSGNLSLLGQAKDVAQKNVADLGTFGPPAAGASLGNLRRDGLRTLSISHQPEMAFSTARDAAAVEAQAAAASRTNKEAVDGPRGARAQLAKASVAAASPAAREGKLILNGAHAAAVTGGGGMIFNENRGRAGYVATDLDRVAPTGGVIRAASTDRYAAIRDNDFLGVVQNPLSTFAIDVDTASYSNVRNFLRNHQRPPRDAVRIEELVNYFPYRYAPPTGAVPFAASLEVADAPWSPTHRLVRIGLKGREIATTARPAANLVFLLDVSGSMNAPNRLPLVKEAMRLLVGRLRADDRVAIVTYAGQSGLALASTPASHAQEILDALDRLSPSGATNGAMGLQLAYDVAKANFVPSGINRVILCTDGDFNVGVTGEGDLTRLIEEKAKSGVALTALGFGMGNLKDATLEQLADRGNGNYGYIDSRREAEKLIVEQINGTLVTIAKDVKIQVEFNPARVSSYRLLGYENRLLKKEDFNNDAVDAGEIGAGHTVTAFYEIVPAGVAGPAGDPAAVDELKYQHPALAPRAAGEASAELLTVKLRYKDPAGDVSKKVEFPLTDSGATFANASTDFKFAAAVAGFGMILRDSPHKGTATLADVVAWAESGSTDDAGGYRAEFIELAHDAEKLEQ